MNDLCVKEVMFNGSPLKACKDANGMVYVGLRWICEGIGLSLDRMKYERKKVQEDVVLYKGVKFFPLGNDKAKSNVLCLQIDYVPLWLAKMSITPKMVREDPLLVERITEYQLRVKDVLAREFIDETSSNVDLAMINQKLDILYDGMGKLTSLIISIMDTKISDAKEIQRIVKSEKEIEKSAYEIWKDDVYLQLNKIADHSFKYSNAREVLNFITRYMRCTYGIVWEQEAKEYKNVHTEVSKPRKLKLIYENETIKSIFESILKDTAYNQSTNMEDTIEGVIRPLIEKLGDTSKNGCRTYRQVFYKMQYDHQVDWEKTKKKYGNTPIGKKDLILGDPELKEIFRTTVREMME